MKMEQVAQHLAQRMADKYSRLHKHRLVVAMAGGPGSGKSTIADQIRKEIESTHHLSCQAVELDGFQFSKAQLNQMEDPERAHERRGSVWTFDAHGVINFIKRCRDQGKKVQDGKEAKDIQAPLFDEEKLDPVPDGEIIKPATQVVIFEGVYFLSHTEPWKEVQGLVDERWFIHVRPEVSRKRVAERRHSKGICKSLEECYEKYDKSDGKNNEYIIQNRGPVDLIIENNEEWSLHEPDGGKEGMKRR